MKKNKNKSRTTGKQVGAISKQCFHNAFHVVSELPEYQDATYVEGVAVHDSGVFVGEHGWLEIDDEIIDPTLPDEELAYFPGLKFEGLIEVQRALSEIPMTSPEDFPILWRFGWGGKESLEVVRAWDEAKDFSNRQTIERPAESAEATL